jgi:hypothetical protein
VNEQLNNKTAPEQGGFLFNSGGMPDNAALYAKDKKNTKG